MGDEQFVRIEPLGDPVCWLPRVCDACGALCEDEEPETCNRCGAEFAAD